MASGVSADNLDSSSAFRAHTAPQPPMRNPTSPALNIKKLIQPGELRCTYTNPSTHRPHTGLLLLDSSRTDLHYKVNLQRSSPQSHGLRVLKHALFLYMSSGHATSAFPSISPADWEVICSRRLYVNKTFSAAAMQICSRVLKST